MPDLTLPIIASVVAALVLAVKQALPGDPGAARDRWTSTIALVLGIGFVMAWAFTRPNAVLTGDVVFNAVVNGIMTGLAAVGGWNTQNDLRNPGGR